MQWVTILGQVEEAAMGLGPDDREQLKALEFAANNDVPRWSSIVMTENRTVAGCGSRRRTESSHDGARS